MALNPWEYFDYARLIQHHRGEYKSSESTANLIRYITRTRPNETRANELLLWGSYYGYSYHKNPEDIISEMKCIQKFYKTKNSLMCHYTLSVSPLLFKKMNNDLFVLGDYAVKCCKYLFNLGHQCCFAIHSSARDKLHIHFAINIVNFHTGKKLRQYPTEIFNNIEVPIYQLLDPYVREPSYSPYYMENLNSEI